MNIIKKLWPLWLIILICSLIYYEFVFLGKVPLPADTLVGAYFPWLDYKWGYVVGVPVKNALTSDAFSTFFVWKKIMIDMYTQGIIPLWNKYSLSGTPLMATFHSTVFNPANLLLLLPTHGWSFYIFSSSLAAVISMYIFLGNFISHKPAKITGALIFAFSGPMTTWAEFGTAVWAATTLPLTLHFLGQSLTQGKPHQYTLVSILVTILVFTGHVQLLTYAFAIIPIYILFIIRHYSVTSKKSLFLTVVSLALGIMIGVVQLLPTVDFYQRSIRGEEKYSQTFNFGLSPLNESIRLIAADFFGNPSRGNHFSPNSYHEYSSYLGVLTLPLIAYLLILGPLTAPIILFLIVFVGSLFLVFDNPVSRLIFSLPLPLLTYSSASRIFFITGFSGGALAAFSIEKIHSKRASLLPLVAFLLLSALFILISLLPIDQLHRSVSIRNSVVYLGIISILLSSLLILNNRRNILIVLILILFSIDLGRYFNKYNTFVKSDLVFPETPVITWLKQQPKPFRIARENTALFPPNTWAYYGIESIEGYDPLYSLDYGRFFHVINAKDYTNAVSRYALLDKVNKKYLDASNVKYFLTVIPLPDESESSTLYDLKKSGFKEVFRDGRVFVFENQDVLDRAYFPSKIINVSTQEEALKAISQPGFDPTKEVVVQDAPQISQKQSGGKLVNINHLDGRVDLDITTETEGFLVLSDSYDPGWKVLINNTRSKIYKTNSSLMGIVIPPGDSHITFSYLPDSFTKGILISATALLISGTLFWIQKIKSP